ncbi:PucR family transcriptional regulator [Mycolicibacter hiberniae]|uniref:DNA-binding protein n=1 Tax=Mycolicibacter hiberniae TaxID=29314 RepID=A0A7I7X1W7_9MYCO|nr:helix-turn-helix domain-containing protein [Mycolicibacter hiberniae]MCV7088086.1 helix-turn-helix domain-containing protein [Mycolicibacter hiberniae]ORV66336.1 PucR family transcriptional regulator [Mycolicibacter hiberniae]BBZ23829.1 DNA-binding protein [Mycolicibacter hiberniae]
MVTLDRLVNVVGSYGVRLRFCSIPRTTSLSSVVMHEVSGERVVVGDVLLAVGARSVKEAVRWAVAAKSSAVLVRDDDDKTAFVAEGEALAVLVVDAAVSWSELAAVVYGLVLEGRETESGRGPTDLFAVADSLAEAVAGAVTIEDESGRLLAYSSGQRHADPARSATILNRQESEAVRALFAQRGVLTHLELHDDPLFVAADSSHGLTGRMVVAVRAGRELLGAVWVATPAALCGERLIALSDGARTVALHLLRSRASADLERQVESDWVSRLLDGGTDPADAVALVARLGLPQAPLRVIAVHTRLATQPHAGLLLAFEAVTTGFGWSRPGRSALAADTVYTLLPAADAEVARQWVRGLAGVLPPNARVLAGISAVATAAELAAARREAQECLALHEAGPPQGVPPAYDESWDEIVLRRLHTAARAGRVPTRGPVAALGQHDATHNTPYVATLRAWLDAQGDSTRAADQLGVHENTVRYRLRKMAEVTPLGLEDPRTRFAAMIELAAGGMSELDKL